jgi:uncharacterized DUF497 family protein
MGEEGDFEWDDEKAQFNADKHRINIEFAALLFDDPFHLIAPANEDSHTQEARYQIIGEIYGSPYRAIYVKREKKIRIISMHRLKWRKANDYYTQRNSDTDS